MVGVLPRQIKLGLVSLVALLAASILMQPISAWQVSQAEAQETNWQGRIPPFFGPYVILTNKYYGQAAADGTLGTVRTLIIKAEEATPMEEAWARINFSLPGDNPTGCLQVFGPVALPWETVHLDFQVCDPSQWDAVAWIRWGIALLVVGQFVPVWVAGALVLATVWFLATD